MTLAFLLSTGPGTADTRTVIALARAALARGDCVRIFLMDDGVLAIRSAELEDLFQRGAEISLCAHSAGPRAIPRPDWVLFGDQQDHAGNLAECDRTLAFN